MESLLELPPGVRRDRERELGVVGVLGSRRQEHETGTEARRIRISSLEHPVLSILSWSHVTRQRSSDLSRNTRDQIKLLEKREHVT